MIGDSQTKFLSRGLQSDSPDRLKGIKNIIAFLVLGCVASGGVVFTLQFFDRRFTDSQEVEEELELTEEERVSLVEKIWSETNSGGRFFMDEVELLEALLDPGEPLTEQMRNLVIRWKGKKRYPIKIAEKYGGGGHKCAAGFAIKAKDSFPWEK